MDNATNKHCISLQSLYVNRSMKAFWNEIKHQRKTKTTSELTENNCKDYYAPIMQENISNHNYNPQDPDFVQRVNHYYNENAYNYNVSTISPYDINVLIDKLRSNASPGVDGITAEHIKNGKCTMLSQLLSFILYLHFVMVVSK